MALSRLDPWVEWGIYFGFPQCCIDAFVTLSHMVDPDLENRPLIGTGFICCPVCAATKTSDQLTAEINSQRVCTKPFPD